MGPKEKKIILFRPQIEEALKNWAFVPNSEEWNSKFSEIIAWLKSFEPSEIESAIKILENIQYYDDNRIRTIVSKLARKISVALGDAITNTLFFPLGTSSASSGSMYIYQYWKELNLSESNFKLENFRTYINDSINIVFFDDIIGSGNQATKFFKNHLKNASANCYYFSLLGLKRGITYIQENAGFKLVAAGTELSDEEMSFTPNSQVFTKEEQDILKPICQKYGKILYEKYPLGYDNTQALIVFPHNTPNNTLPIIWASEKNEARDSKKIWSPLFERRKIIKSPEEKLKIIKSNFTFNRDQIIKEALNFVKHDFHKVNQSRRFNLTGKSGTGKTYLIKNIIANLHTEDVVLYIDLNSDDFFINLFFELLIYSSINEYSVEGGIRIGKNDSFAYFLESNNYISNKEQLIRLLYNTLQQLPGVIPIMNTTEYFVEDASLPHNNMADYFFRYIKWIAERKKIYLVIDNYQFLTNKIKTEFESNLSFITHNLCFITIIRLKEYDLDNKLESLCFKEKEYSIALSELNIEDISNILRLESVEYQNRAADCFLKTNGNLKEIEYYIVQLRQNISLNQKESNIRSLVDNIKYLPDLERYLMTISSLFPTGMDRNHINQLMQIILLVDEDTFNQSINSLIRVGYLILNGNSGNILKPAHEKIITSLSKSLGDDSFLEMQETLVNSLELMLSNMTPDKEYNYLLHCFVGIFTADQFKSKLNYVIKLLDIQFKANQYYYLVTFYKSACRQHNWIEIINFLPLFSLEQLLDSMQKTSEFYCGMKLLGQIKQSNRQDVGKLMIYEVKYLTQTYCFEQALELIESYDLSEQTILYKLNILQHLGRDVEAKKVVNDLTSHNSEVFHSEYFYVILRNTAQYFSVNKAISNLEIVHTYFLRKGLKFGVATTKNNLGVVYLWSKELDVAERYLLEAEKLFNEVFSNEVFEPQCNLSVLYSLKGDEERSIYYSKQALSSFPKNLTYDYVMLLNNQQIIELEQQICSLEDTLRFFQEQYSNIHRFMDPWLTFIIEYNLSAIEVLLTKESSISPDIDKYYTVPEDETGSLVFKSIIIEEKELELVFALSPNWRY